MSTQPNNPEMAPPPLPPAVPSPAQRAVRSLARSPADCKPRHFARYNGKPVDPQQYLPKR